MKRFQRLHAAPRQRGITIVEALVAFLIITIGMLTLSQLQTQLRYNADLSKQRSEAVRIAQEDIERQRAYTQLAAGGTGVKSFDAIASAPAANVVGITTNTTYQLSRAVTDSVDPNFKSLRVSVAWTDRNNQSNEVALETLLSRTDPTLTAQVSIPPAGTPARNPFNRNVRIPVSSVNLGNGKSGFSPPGASGFYFVLDNSNADVIEKCTGTLSAAAYNAIKNPDPNNIPDGSCDTGKRGYLLSGFINFDLRHNVSATAPGSTVCNFYADAQSAGLIPSGQLSVFQVSSIEPQQTAPTFANAVTIDPSTALLTNAYGVDISGNLVVAFTSNMKGGANVLQFVTATKRVVLRVKGGNEVETYTPIGASSTTASGSAGGTITLQGSNQSLTMTIDPGPQLREDTQYEIVIPDGTLQARKNAGTPDTAYGGNTLGFTTGPSPRLVSSDPPAGTAIEARAQAISLKFSENVRAGTSGGAFIKLWRSRVSGEPVQTFSPAAVGFGGDTVTLTPAASLLPGADYFVTVDSGAITDVVGNPYVMVTPLRFSTQTVTAGACPTLANVTQFMDLQLDLTSSGHPNPAYECFSDSAAAATTGTTQTIGYFCAVYAADQTTGDGSDVVEWSGTLKLKGPQGWVTGGSARYKVCRYFDPDGNGVVPNEQHPATYSHVQSALTDQNFLVIRNNESCPSEVLDIGSHTGVSVYFKTTQLQPPGGA